MGFAGGPDHAPGTGERFGIEGPDRSWARGVASNEGIGAINDAFPIEGGGDGSPGLAYAADPDSPEGQRVLRQGQRTVREAPQNRGLFGLSDDASSGLIAAGLGMLASRSPFLGTAIGEGGLTGINTYNTLQKQREDRGQKQQTIDQAAQKLSDEIEMHRKDLKQKTKAASDTLSLNREKLEQEQWKPFTDQYGIQKGFYNSKNPSQVISNEEMEARTKRGIGAPPVPGIPPAPQGTQPAPTAPATPIPGAPAGAMPVAGDVPEHV